MKYSILATPLFNTVMEVGAYMFKLHNNDKMFGLSDNHMALDGVINSPSIDIINELGIESLTGGKPIFVNLNQYCLLADTYRHCKIPPELMIFVISNDVPMEKTYIDKCENIKNAGYSLALSNINYSVKSSSLFNLSDYLIFSTSDEYFMEKIKVSKIRHPYIKIIVKDIEDKNQYDSLKMLSDTLFGGRFYSQPITKGVKEVNPLKANAMHLLKLVNDEDFDLDDASKIIQQDTALSLSLLKFINSPAIGITSKVRSIRNAVALLGQRETRKWITVAVSAYLMDDKPNEITKLSLTRGKFAENLATSFELGIHAPSLFLMGLFSLLDVILDKPMAQAVNEISISGNIKNALIMGEGPYKDVIKLIYKYEQGEWKAINYIAVTNNIEMGKISQAFLDSLTWYKALLDSLENSLDDDII